MNIAGFGPQRCQIAIHLFIVPPFLIMESLNKPLVLAHIQKTLDDELAVLTRGARASFAAATDPDSRAENKYDTRTLEASYVARGQAQRVQELQSAIHLFQALAQEVASSPSIRLGSLIRLDEDQYYFMGPGAGGTEVTLDGKEILIITPASPLGQKLMGKRVGDQVEHKPGMGFRITQVG